MKLFKVLFSASFTGHLKLIKIMSNKNFKVSKNSLIGQQSYPQYSRPKNAFKNTKHE